MAKHTFLVVDDDPLVLEITRARLERLGFEVVTRNQSLGTSGWIARNAPDFVLVDVLTPALTNGTLARVLERRGLSTRVILYSTRPDDELEETVGRLRCLGTLSKSLDEPSFEAEILRLTREASEPRSRDAGERFAAASTKR